LPGSRRLRRVEPLQRHFSLMAIEEHRIEKQGC
jgi:hypothetical protein